MIAGNAQKEQQRAGKSLLPEGPFWQIIRPNPVQRSPEQGSPFPERRGLYLPGFLHRRAKEKPKKQHGHNPQALRNMYRRGLTNLAAETLRQSGADSLVDHVSTMLNSEQSTVFTQRVSRKRFMQTATLATAALTLDLSLVGCGSSEVAIDKNDQKLIPQFYPQLTDHEVENMQITGHPYIGNFDKNYSLNKPVIRDIFNYLDGFLSSPYKKNYSLDGQDTTLYIYPRMNFQPINNAAMAIIKDGSPNFGETDLHTTAATTHIDKQKHTEMSVVQTRADTLPHFTDIPHGTTLSLCIEAFQQRALVLTVNKDNKYQEFYANSYGYALACAITGIDYDTYTKSITDPTTTQTITVNNNQVYTIDASTYAQMQTLAKGTVIQKVA